MTQKRDAGYACFTLRLSPSVRKRFKLQCVKNEITMVERIRGLINEDLKKVK